MFSYAILMLVTGTAAFGFDIPLGVGFNMLSMVRDCNSLPSLISCLVDFISDFWQVFIKILRFRYIIINIINIVNNISKSKNLSANLITALGNSHLRPHGKW